MGAEYPCMQQSIFIERRRPGLAINGPCSFPPAMICYLNIALSLNVRKRATKFSSILLETLSMCSTLRKLFGISWFCGKCMALFGLFFFVDDLKKKISA